VKIGVLTGGGDAPGLNAAIRAVTRHALLAGDTVVGVRNGWAGMLGEGDTLELGRREVAGILPLGGTILGTSSKVNPVTLDGGEDQVMSAIRRLRLDALVAIGGDGTLSIASHFATLGAPLTAIGKTIDNDLSVTEYCIGFDSAVTIVAEALDRLHTTATAHHRVMVLEVMGRDTGWLAAIGGLAGGADMVVIPEVPTTVDDLLDHLRARRAAGSDFSLVVVAEGASIHGLRLSRAGDPPDANGHRATPRMALRGVGERLAAVIESSSGVETRATVLGHTQRGGTPSAFDRIWATRVGVAAHQFAADGQFGSMPVVRDGTIATAPIADVARKHRLPPDWYDLAKVFF